MASDPSQNSLGVNEWRANMIKEAGLKLLRECVPSEIKVSENVPPAPGLPGFRGSPKYSTEKSGFVFGGFCKRKQLRILQVVMYLVVRNVDFHFVDHTV